MKNVLIQKIKRYKIKMCFTVILKINKTLMIIKLFIISTHNISITDKWQNYNIVNTLFN